MDDTSDSKTRLVIVSNRLPIILTRGKDAEWRIDPGSGGLVTAMAPVLRNRGGVWIGWPGNIAISNNEAEKLLVKESKKFGYDLKPVELSKAEKENFYIGFANEVIWPLFHDFIAHCRFDPEYWKTYQTVNRKFAQVIKDILKPEDFIWIHDYHLMCVATELRKMGVKNQIGFFLHIPFPPTDVFVRLPWRLQLLNSLLDYDLIGFQTMRDRRNFTQAIRSFLKDTRGIGKGQVFKVSIGKREIRIGAFPISIDYNEFAQKAKTQEVADRAKQLHKDFFGQKNILGIDRLDYSKGIPERLKGFRNALRRYPEIRQKATLIQVVVPSRREIKKYADLKIEIERLVGEINGQFTEPGWIPIHYIFRTLNREELIAYYRMSEIALITPLKDGMNLIAKEYCASNLEEDGILVMSEFAGSVAQFQRGAILVNPHDIEGMADAIYKAFKMGKKDRLIRMRKLRRLIQRQDIFWWVDSFLEAAISKHLENFPVIEDYLPISEEQNFK